jgi:hypothetical protein
MKYIKIIHNTLRTYSQCNCTDLDLAKLVVRMERKISKTAPSFCSQKLPYLNQYILDLDNGIFESHLHVLNFSTPIRWCELDEGLLSHFNFYSKQGNKMKLCSNDDCKNCCIFINIGRILIIKYSERIYRSRSF